MKKILYLLIANVVLVGGNVFSWYISLKLDYQLAWIAFILVFINLVLSWLVYPKQKTIMYFFLSSSLIIELLLIINFYWIQRRGFQL